MHILLCVLARFLDTSSRVQGTEVLQEGNLQGYSKSRGGRVVKPGSTRV